MLSHWSKSRRDASAWTVLETSNCSIEDFFSEHGAEVSLKDWCSLRTGDALHHSLPCDWASSRNLSPNNLRKLRLGYSGALQFIISPVPCSLRLNYEMPQLCITGTGYFGASRQRVKHLSEVLGLQYIGELTYGITKVLVVADDPNASTAELLAGQKSHIAALWGNIPIVSHQWLEDSAQRGTLCDFKQYFLLPPSQKEVPTAGTQAATCTDEQSRLQTELTGPKGDHNTCSPLTFVDTPEVLRKAKELVPPRVLKDLFDSGSPALPRSCPSSGPCDMQPDKASKPDGHTAYSTESSSDIDQADQHHEADTTQLTQHLPVGSSALLPQPLQLLGGDMSKCTTPADARAGDSNYAHSPQSVRVRGENKLKRAPKQSTAASFHRVPASSITYYDTLTVEHPELDRPLAFCTHDPGHCALVHYEDSTDGETRDLAYAQLLYCYRLAKDDRIYIEYRYLYDADDVRQQRSGSAFLEQHSMAKLELVLSPEVYHSLAEVIDGEFWLVDRVTAEQRADEAGDLGAEAAQLCLFCELSWDRLTGSLLSMMT